MSNRPIDASMSQCTDTRMSERAFMNDQNERKEKMKRKRKQHVCMNVIDNDDDNDCGAKVWQKTWLFVFSIPNGEGFHDYFCKIH